MKLINLTLEQFISVNAHIGNSLINSSNTTYLVGLRNRLPIFDMEQTLFLLKKASSFLFNVTKTGHKVLFVSLSKQPSALFLNRVLSKKSLQLSYSSTSWQGGLLSGWRSLTKQQFKKFAPLLRKKNKLSFNPNLNVKRTDKEKLLRWFDIISNLTVFIKRKRTSASSVLGEASTRVKLVYPSAVCLYNPIGQHAPLNEIRKVGLPLVGMVDSNTADVSVYSFPIPVNMTYMATYKTIAGLLTYACLQGVQVRRCSFWVK
uniref:Ribosomal protein S2 n=1 Tax=Tsukubamonas globosa TaxID=875863 RepID=W8VRB9_9EUKA|nr:ribosomal protein S2 [Tsukubamonas globosa]BAO51979.1 ribosomal protein S2 [Tsukubamonas globosa]